MPRQRFLVDRSGVVGFASREILRRDSQAAARITSDDQARSFLDAHPLFRDGLAFLPRDLTTTRGFATFARRLLTEVERSGEPRLTLPIGELQEWVTPGPRAFHGPLVVLIDGLTVSAGEVVAAILKDNERARLVGATTAGAGGDQRAVMVREACPGADGWLAQNCLDGEAGRGLRALGLEGFTKTFRSCTFL